ncbi:MAG: VPLPA-CTERM sorting domain-containing protein [Sneathiella sp.]
MKKNGFLLKTMGVAAVIGAISFFGGANQASAAFSCSVNASSPGNGTCWNAQDSNSDSTGDFRTDAGWIDRFQTNGRDRIQTNGRDRPTKGGGKKGGGKNGNWDDLDFLTTGLLASQFSTQDAFRAQSPDNVESILEGSDWFGQELTLVGSGDISGKSVSGPIEGNVIYIHTGGFSMAFLYDGIPAFDFFIEGVGKGLSNYRVYNTVSAVPIPAALPLFGAALLGLGYLGRRRKQKAQLSA